MINSIDPKPMQLHLLKQGDWWGIASMAIGLASLQVVLETDTFLGIDRNIFYVFWR